MEPKRFAWSSPTGPQEFVFAWVPETSGIPYSFGHGDRRKDIHLDGFYIGTTPVTQALWELVMGENPAVHRDPCCPVENISWERITESGGFLDRINASEALTSVASSDPNLRFRLPTETEWEYAARGGPHWRDDFAFSGSNNPDAVAWYGPRWGRADQALLRIFGWPVGWRVVGRLRKLVRSQAHADPSGRHKSAESIVALRYVWERVGMVPGRLRRRSRGCA